MIDKLPYGFINSVYGFNDYTLNELICKLVQKMDEVITQSNESFNFLDWLKDQGVPKEIQNIMNTMIEDGTLEKLINIDKINSLKTELSNKINEINLQMDNITYLAPVSNDVTILQEFIDSLPNNVNLKFPKNTYLIDDVLIFRNKSNITIDLSDVIFQTNKHGYGILELYACENVTINGGTLIGANNFYPNTINSDSLSNEKELTKSFWGSVRNSKSGTIAYNNGFLGSCGIGLLIHQFCKNITVNNLKAKYFNFSGISIGFRGDGDYSFGNSSNTVYSENITINNCNCCYNFSSGINILAVNDCIIKNNICSYNGHPDAQLTDKYLDPGYGITCTGTNQYAKNVIIENNTCNYNKRKGIDVHSGENIQIINNKCRGNFAYGIACVTNNKTNEPLKDYFIKNNVIIDCANSNHVNGNYAIIGQGECLGIIDGNIIKESGKTGFNIYCVDGNKEINNNNIIKGGKINSIYAYCTQTSINNNNIESENDGVIKIGSPSTGNCESLTINNNKINLTGNKILLYANGITRGICSNNICKNNNKISFGENTSRITFNNNYNFSYDTNVTTSECFVVGNTFDILFSKVGVNLNFTDFSKSLISRCESDANGIKFYTRRTLGVCSINIMPKSSNFNNVVKNCYVREIGSNYFIIGLSSTVNGAGEAITTFEDISFFININKY